MNFPGAGAPSGGASGYDPNDPNLNSLMESCYAKTAMSGVAGFGLGALFGMFMASMAYDTPFHTAAPVTSTPAASTTASTATTTSGTAATSSSTTAQPKAATSSSPIARAAAATANSTVAPIKTPTAAAAAATTSAAAAAAPSASAAAGAAMLPNPGAPLSSLPLRQQLAVGFKDMGARSYSTAKNFAMVGALFSGIECGIEGLRAKNDMGNGVAAGCITGAILARNGGPQAAAVGCAGFAAFSAAIDAWLRMPKDE